MLYADPILKFPALLLLALLGACSKPAALPEFADPVPLKVPSGPASEGPRLSVSQDGQIVLSWMERLSIGGGALHFSALLDGVWRAPGTVVNDPGMFVNWADIPSVVPLGGDTLFAHWLRKSADSTYAYDVQSSHSTDGGATWADPSSPHDDGTPTEHGFVSVSQDEQSTHLIWLDGRKTAGDHTDNVSATGMTLRAADLSADGSVENEQLLDELVCDCCRTDMAMTAAGRVAVYRNRTSDEIRDVFISRQIDGDWQDGVPLSNDGWKIAGCPVNGPAVAASGDFVAVAWFTAANDRPKVQVQLSIDAGHTFGDAILISDNGVVGQVDIEILDDRSVAVSWVEKTSAGSRDVRLAAVNRNGNKSDSFIVGTSAYSRTVPQMVLDNDALLFVWTDQRDNGVRLNSTRVSIVKAN